MSGERMRRRILGFNGGRARIWWVHHGQQAVRALQLIALICAYLAVSTFDHQDQLEQERSARAAATEALRQERAARGLPRTTFVIEAKTPQEASLKLAEIAGDLDGWRARNRGQK